MIVALSYSTSYSKERSSSLSIFSTGGLKSNSPLEEVDSFIQVDINDIKLVNAKLIELKYLTDENNVLRGIITNDSIIIKEKDNRINILYNTIEEIQEDIAKTEKEHKQQIKKLKKDKVYLTGSSLILFAIIIVLL